MAGGATVWEHDHQLSGDHGLNHAAMAIAPNGNVIYTWTEWSPTRATNVVKAKIVSFEGEVLKEPFEFGGPGLGKTSLGEANPSVAVLHDGTFVVTYQMTVSGRDQDIYQRQFTSEGDFIFGPFGSSPDVTTGTGVDKNAIVIGNPNTNSDIKYTVFWERDGSIYTRSFRYQFNPIGEEVILSSGGTGLKRFFPDADYHRSGVGLYVDATESRRSPTDYSYSISVKHFNGSTWSNLALLNVSDVVVGLDVTTVRDGFLVTWSENPQGGRPALAVSSTICKASNRGARSS
jgi:hypothetical protein